MANSSYPKRTFEDWWDECIGAGPDPDRFPNPTWTHEELKEHCRDAFNAAIWAREDPARDVRDFA